MVGTKKNTQSVKHDWLAKIQQFHFETRALQLSEINHPRWGLAVPFYVYTHDHVPITLYPNHVKTVENRGFYEVYDCANSDKDTYRFCTLNLEGSM